MMIPYYSFSALMSGNSPMSALQSHLPLHYLGSGALSSLKGAVCSWDLDMAISCEEVICSSCSGRCVADPTAYGLRCDGSLGDQGFCGPIICPVKIHVIMCSSHHLQVKHHTTIAPSLVVASSDCETLVLLVLETCFSLPVTEELWFYLHWGPTDP